MGRGSGGGRWGVGKNLFFCDIITSIIGTKGQLFSIPNCNILNIWIFCILTSSCHFFTLFITSYLFIYLFNYIHLYFNRAHIDNSLITEVVTLSKYFQLLIIVISRA